MYDHKYDTTVEIIIQNGLHTKAIGTTKVIDHLVSILNFSNVILFTLGNSSNDIGMLKLANKYKPKVPKGYGSSYWIGCISKVSLNSLKNVGELQRGLHFIWRYIGDRGWQAPRDNRA